jgi:hypothetical protein
MVGQQERKKKKLIMAVAIISLTSFVNKLYECVVSDLSEGRVAAAVSRVAAPVGDGIAMRSAKVERRVMSDDPVPRRGGRKWKFKIPDESCCYCYMMTDNYLL